MERNKMKYSELKQCHWYWSLEMEIIPLLMITLLLVSLVLLYNWPIVRQIWSTMEGELISRSIMWYPVESVRHRDVIAECCLRVYDTLSLFVLIWALLHFVLWLCGHLFGFTLRTGRVDLLWMLSNEKNRKGENKLRTWTWKDGGRYPPNT